MDIDAFFQLDDIEDEEMEHEQLLAGMATTVLLIGAIEAQRLRAERRKPSRLYLCRPQLLPLPRVATPWQVARACGWRATNGSHGASEDEVWRGDISDTQPKEERERTSDGRIRLKMVY
ncbi:hypothetical protein B0H13DRAFT_1895712 [Mycena leptocephala]|nr:hypothetical protein B0H13DRAFT_1895712 [Mycena leptocephala]